jgi:hypothetical protein
MTDFVFGIFGIICGLLCAFADILFELKVKNNIKSSPAKIIDSNWQIISGINMFGAIFEATFL